MAGAPDLFVVCKSCGSEVSPYITECPYCGNRLRKRAPKLDRPGAPPKPERRLGRRGAKPPPRKRAKGRERADRPSVPRDYSGAGGKRPWAAFLLVLVPVITVLLARAGAITPFDFVLFGGADDPWRWVTTLFYYESLAYEFVALAVTFLFAWLLQRRHGAWAPLLVFLAGGVAGSAVVAAVDPAGLATGANGAALALLAAWAMRDMLAVRRGEEVEGDLLGAAALAVVVVLLPAAVEEAHSLAGATGGLIGLVLGAVLAKLPER